MTYREFVLRTANGGVTQDMHRVNAALGLCGEAGEFADVVKKWFAQGHALDRDKAIKELGDVRWYLELAAWALGTTLEEVEQRNIAKLSARYPNGFDTNASLNRKPD